MPVAELLDPRVLDGLDALEDAPVAGDGRVRAVWRGTWPKLAAVALAVAAWQVVVWTGWRPQYVLPPPLAVSSKLRSLATEATFWKAIGLTLRRAAVGFVIASAVGGAMGIAVSRVRVLRTAVGSMITGLQTMPSIAWFPLAILLFQLSESAILFVVVLGAAPSVANGIITGVDHVPPLLLRAGRVVGARGLAYDRHVVLPAALPSILGGLKQGWAFAWRSLMAGELLVIVANKPSIGARLQFARELSDAEGLLAYMIVILVIGVVVDTAFGATDRRVRARRGLA
jgi:NitT/TauT family transport system permease protein